MNENWSISKTTGTCAVSGKPLAEGTPIIAAIYDEPGGEGFVRRDFSLDAFATTGGRLRLEEGGELQTPFSHWQTRVPSKDEKKRTFVDDNVLVDFFDRLADAVELKRQQFRYVLALILMRKKLLKIEDIAADDEGRERWKAIRIHPTERDNRGARLKMNTEVRVPPMNEDELGPVAEQLGTILAGDDEALAEAA